MKTHTSRLLANKRFLIMAGLAAAAVAGSAGLLLPFRAHAQTTVAARQTAIATAMFGKPVFGYVGDTVTLSALLQIRTRGLPPLAGQKVQFMVNNGIIAEAITDATGHATVSGRFASPIWRGVTAIFRGAGAYSGSQTSGFATIRAKPAPGIKVPGPLTGVGINNTKPKPEPSEIDVAAEAIDIGSQYDAPIHIYVVEKGQPVVRGTVYIHIGDQYNNYQGEDLVKTTDGQGKIDFRFHPYVTSPPPNKLGFPLKFTVGATYNPPGEPTLQSSATWEINWF